MIRIFLVIFIFLFLQFSYGEEDSTVEQKVVDQSIEEKEIGKLKYRITELEKNQKNILKNLTEKKGQDLNNSFLEEKLNESLRYQKQLSKQIYDLEREIRFRLFLQNVIQFVIFGIFFIFMILLYRYKKERSSIESEIDDVFSKIDDSRRETIRLLIEKSKEDPRLASALKTIIEEENK